MAQAQNRLTPAIGLRPSWAGHPEFNYRPVSLQANNELVDAAQLIAHRVVEMAGWGIDYLAFSAHKVYAHTLIQALGEIARQPRARDASDVRQQMDDFSRAAARRVYDPQV